MPSWQVVVAHQSESESSKFQSSNFAHGSNHGQQNFQVPSSNRNIPTRQCSQICLKENTATLCIKTDNDQFSEVKCRIENFDDKDSNKVIVVSDKFFVQQDFAVAEFALIHSPVLSEILERFQNKRQAREGVNFADELVSSSLREALSRQIDTLSNTSPVDYHPNSHDIVRDHVHPALYSYVEGVSEFVPSKDLPQKPSASQRDGKDMWQRPWCLLLHQSTRPIWIHCPSSIQ